MQHTTFIHFFFFAGGENFEPNNPDQVLLAEDLPLMGIKTFGYALGGGYDLDLNNHSDITVGAFGSDAAFVVRSRHVQKKKTRQIIKLPHFFKKKKNHDLTYFFSFKRFFSSLKL